MAQAHQNTARVIETATYEKPPRREAVLIAHKTPVKIPSLQQLKEVFATLDFVNEGERQARNITID